MQPLPFGPYLSPFYSPELFGDPNPRLVRPEASRLAWLAALSRRRSHSRRSRPGFASPATTTAAPITKPSGPTRRPAPWVSRVSHYRRRVRLSADPPKRPSLLPLPGVGLFILILVHDVWKALWFADPPPAKSSSGSASGRLLLAVNVVLLAGTRWAAIRCGIWSAGSSTALAASRYATEAYACVSCLNSRHMRWAWPSLFSVAFSDVYIRLCSMGIWHDWRFF